MNVTVDIANDCPQHQVPKPAEMESWIKAAGKTIAPDGKAANVSIKIVSEQDSANLNKQYRDKDYPTNVLSFSCSFPSNATDSLGINPLGDIAICAPIVENEARQQGKTLAAHWAHLLTHGFLHLNGYVHDDADSAQEMESIEIAILAELGFPNPYLLPEDHKESPEGLRNP